MENLISLLFFLSPVILGSIVYFLKFDQVVSTVESLNEWLTKKREKYLGQPGYFKRIVIRPFLWSMSLVMTQSEKIDDKYSRTAVRVGAYLYLFGIFLFVAYIAIALVVTLFIIMIALWIISFFTGGDTPSYRTSTVSNRIRGKKVYNTEGLFNEQTHRIDEDGNIYDTSGLIDNKVGKITEDGRILDTQGLFAKHTGKIDGAGNIYDTSGIIDKKVGEMREDGTIKDTTGVFSKEKGKLG